MIYQEPKSFFPPHTASFPTAPDCLSNLFETTSETSLRLSEFILPATASVQILIISYVME